MGRSRAGIPRVAEARRSGRSGTLRDPAKTGPIPSNSGVESASLPYRLPPFLVDWADCRQRRLVLEDLANRDAAVRAARRELEASVVAARAAGLSWQGIGLMVGISGEGVRRKFSR